MKHNGSLNLITLRYRLKDVPVKGAKAAFKVGDVEFSGRVADRESASDRAARKWNRSAWSRQLSPAAPTVATVNVDLPRIAMFTTWSNTEKVGWVRLAFDRWEIPFDLIHKDHVQAGANLRAKYDVIVMPHQGTGGKSDRLRTTEAVEAAALQEERQVQDAGLLRRDRRRARRHGPRRARRSSRSSSMRAAC